MPNYANCHAARNRRQHGLFSVAEAARHLGMSGSALSYRILRDALVRPSKTWRNSRRRYYDLADIELLKAHFEGECHEQV